MPKSMGLRRATDMHWTVSIPGCKMHDLHPLSASSTTDALLSPIPDYSVKAQPDLLTVSLTNKSYPQTSKAEGGKNPDNFNTRAYIIYISFSLGLHQLSSQAFLFIDTDLNKKGSIGAFQTNIEGQIFLCLQGITPQWQQHRMASQQGSPEGQISSLTHE